MEINLTPEMNETVKDLLRLNGNPMELYALARIEELERQVNNVPPNDPLTLDELQAMKLMEWVWIEVIMPERENGVKSAYFRKSGGYKPEEFFSCGYPGWGTMFDYADYGKTWVAYRRRPEEGME